MPPDVTVRPDGVIEKRVPHHDLARVQALVVALGPSAFTRTATNGGFAMGLMWAEMRDVVVKMDQSCFYKSMTSYGNQDEWQDVYHAPVPTGRVAYIKIIWKRNAPVIQFKER